MLATRLLFTGAFLGVPAIMDMQGFLAYASTGQSVPDMMDSPLEMDSEEYDTEAMHFTSSAALTGTVAKTAASATLTGSGSAFLTELSPNQVIGIPKTLTGTVSKTAGNATITGSGTAFLTELAVGQRVTIPGGARTTYVFVRSIASDTSFTALHAPAQTASGQTVTAEEHVAIASVESNTSATLRNVAQTSVSGATATRRNYAASIPAAGYWDFYGYWYTGTNLSQDCPAALFVNGQIVRGAQFTPWTQQPSNVGGIGQMRSFPRWLDVGDIVWFSVYWDDDGDTSGGTIGGSTAFTQTVFGGFLVGT